jgi:hypothetical protein
MSIIGGTPVGVRWTVGDVSPRGWEELRLSIHGALRLFGPTARYAVCVNSVALGEARERTGAVPECVEWKQVDGELPAFLSAHLDRDMSEGVGWKLAPLRLFPDRHELSLDNDCILWAAPRGLEDWLEPGDACLIAEDVRRCLGRFDADCPPGQYNSGVRGLPPGFDLGAALRAILDGEARNAGGPVPLRSELDEQGLQTAALARVGRLLTVNTEELSICSPFWPHQRELGSCGAHFVGSNARHIAWDYYDRPADAWAAEHWQTVRNEVYARVGLACGEDADARAEREPSLRHR